MSLTTETRRHRENKRQRCADESPEFFRICLVFSVPLCLRGEMFVVKCLDESLPTHSER
jgi:hypothetical protein